MTRCFIPATIEEAADRCAALDGIARATGWERAAIVWAFTEKSAGGRPLDETGNCTENRTVSIRAFSRLGIQGLTRAETVLRYHDAWQAVIDSGNATGVHPGDEITLPDQTWPPAEDNLRVVESTDPETAARIEQEAAKHGITRNVVAQIVQRPGGVEAAIKASPRIAAAARRALEDEREDRDLNTLARGGRVQPLEEINRNVGRKPIDGMIARLQTFDRGLHLIAEGKAVLATMGPLNESEQTKVRDAAVALLDLFLDVNTHSVGA